MPKLSQKPDLDFWQDCYQVATGDHYIGKVTRVFAATGRIGGAAIWVHVSYNGQDRYYSPYFDQSAFDGCTQKPNCTCDGCQITQDSDAFVWMMEGAADWDSPEFWEHFETFIPDY
jgi:hypothetical protein